MNDLIDLVTSIIGNRTKALAIVEALVDAGYIQPKRGNTEVQVIIDCFKRVFGTTSHSRYDRYAASRLANLHSAPTVCDIIETLGQKRHEQFCPLVGSISELEKKWVAVQRFLDTPPEVDIKV